MCSLCIEDAALHLEGLRLWRFGLNFFRPSDNHLIADEGVIESDGGQDAVEYLRKRHVSARSGNALLTLNQFCIVKELNSGLTPQLLEQLFQRNGFQFQVHGLDSLSNGRSVHPGRQQQDPYPRTDPPNSTLWRIHLHIYSD